jgi:beta-lactamase regulating signal transducer with metallopeptidase domain
LNFPVSTHWFAALAFERLVYCLAGGTALGSVMWVVLRLLPGKNSRTQFAVWFSTLVAVALMPLMAFGPSGLMMRGAFTGTSGQSHAVIAIPASWAEYIVLAWGALAMAGVVRVLAGMWQLRRLRHGCVPVDLDVLSRASLARIAEVSQRRRISILVSSDVEVPTAMGFIHPAIVIPAWMTEEDAATELEYVLLHELAHLERWDDWSNLVQKLIKSMLFFHPAVWWIERKLSLDREMACDDAVLVHAPNPRRYAECLARVAEKRFMRRQIALAQAAVDRVKPLSSRVARILSSDSNRSTRLWKPAVPMVLGVAALCGVSTFRTTELVRFTEPQPKTAAGASDLQIPLAKSGGADQVASVDKQGTMNSTVIPARATVPTQAKAWAASLKIDKQHGSLLPARHQLKKNKPSPMLRSANNENPIQAVPDAAALARLTNFDPSAGFSPAGFRSEARESEETPSGAIVVVMATQRIVSTRSGTWQFSTWELRLIVPSQHPVKPIPRKT